VVRKRASLRRGNHSNQTDVKESSSEPENARLLEKPGVRKKNLRDERTQPGPDSINSGFLEPERGGSVIITVTWRVLAVTAVKM
jgi:hypothetical protein